MVRCTPAGRGARLALTAALFLTFGALAGAAERPLAVPGELLVGLKGDVSGARVQAIVAQAGAKLLRRFDLTPALQIAVPEATLASARSYLEGLPDVEYVEPNFLRYADAVPTDPRYSAMWNLNNTGQTGGTPGADVQAQDAWTLFTGSSSLVVADIDSGMALTHPDLAANLWTNPGEIAGNGVDDDGNGFVDDVHGWDFAYDDADPTDTDAVCSGHGTHTAGTIGAVGDNGVGVTGINWQVKLMPLRAFKRYQGIFCSGSSADILASIQYATKMHVRVSNNSYGGGSFSQAEYNAIRASRMVFVAAAGNEGLNNDVSPSYPASYDLLNVVAVAATDSRDKKASFSNYGTKTVDLAAPGVGIWSTIPPNTYGLMDGTSMACPHVAGAVALQMAADPTLTNNEVQWRVLRGVDKLSLPVTTGGRLNLYNTLARPAPTVTAVIDPQGPITVPRGGTARWIVAVSNGGPADAVASLTVVVVGPNGAELQVSKESISVAAGGSVQRDFSKVVPAGAPVGQYRVSARAEVAGVSFDEALATYTITL